MALLGTHLGKRWATTQTVMALSSGEAEYDGIAKGTCEGLGIVGAIQDLSGEGVKIYFLPTPQQQRGSQHEWASER